MKVPETNRRVGNLKMGNKSVFDTHCHLFNGSYLFDELREMWHAMRVETYPFAKPGVSLEESTQPTTTISVSYKTIFEIIKHFYNIGRALVTNYETQYNYIKSELETNLGNGKNAIIVPQMMDVFYMYAYSDKKEPHNNTTEKTPDISQVKFVAEAASSKDIDNSIKELLNELQEKYPMENQNGEDIEQIEKGIKNIFEPIPEKNNMLESSDGVFLTNGYKKHMEELEELKKRHTDNVFPFLAVDPRRPGIVKYAEEKVGKDKPFHGIKLYTRLGYLPDSDELSSLFEFCSKDENDIPITVHCSNSGFPLNGWKFPLPKPHVDFADPGEWESVLEKYPKLRINFAHFASGHPSESSEALLGWRNKIVEFMDNYPNVYADLAYLNDEVTLKDISELMNKNNTVSDRLMFGTDYVMILLDPNVSGNLFKSSFDEYIELFKKVFDKNQLKKLITDNPAKFLKQGVAAEDQDDMM